MAVKRKQKDEDMKILVNLGDEYAAGTPWKVTFWAGKLRGVEYVCSYDGTTYVRAEKVNDTHVLCKLDNHGLSAGMLYAKVEVMLADTGMPDGDYRVVQNGLVTVTETTTNAAGAVTGTTEYHVELVYANGDVIGTPEVTVTLLGSVIKGSTGAAGTNGTNGSDGKSAYQLAVDNGYTGTVTEWLESLKGAKGDKMTLADMTDAEKAQLKGSDGADGKDGQDGYTPQKGVDYFDGDDGADGNDGADGYVMFPTCRVDAGGYLVMDVPGDGDPTNMTIDDEGYLCVEYPDIA